MASIIVTAISGFIVSSAIIHALERDGGRVCWWCKQIIRWGGIGISITASWLLKYYKILGLTNIEEFTVHKLFDLMMVKPSSYLALYVARVINCNCQNCVIGRS